MLDLPPQKSGGEVRGHPINVLGTVNQAGAMGAQDQCWCVKSKLREGAREGCLWWPSGWECALQCRARRFKSCSK